MELKVWVEGIQRVICGVTENTTCQDVVVALAHATGKTGRFTLVEKWRDNERLLAPAEKPLKSLHKWGEYATDVQFILRHSDRNKSNHHDGRSETFSHNFTPHQPHIKKSLTFSGAHSYTPRATKGQGQRAGPIQENSSLESLDERSSQTSRSSYSSTSPYASLEKHRTSKQIPSKYGSLDRPRTKPKPAPRTGPAATSSPYGSLERPHKLQRSQFSGPSQNGSPFNSLERKHKQTLPTIHQKQPSPNLDVEEYDLDKNLPDLTKDVSENSGFNSEEFSEKVTNSPKTEVEDLMKLVGLQQERLGVQETQLKMINSEIHFWEERDSEQEKQTKALGEEILRLETRERSLTDEILEIDSVRWNDELEVEKQNEQTLQSELTLLRSKVANCESELLQFKNKMQLLMDEIEAEKRDQSKYEQECRVAEIKTLQEIAEIQKSINKNLMQQEGGQENLEDILSEVKLLECAISEKKTQIADLEADIRKVNLELFMKVPISPKAPSPSGSGLIRSRPGSARKMTGNPQSLGEAVPTVKNPHGMWV